MSVERFIDNPDTDWEFIDALKAWASFEDDRDDT